MKDTTILCALLLGSNTSLALLALFIISLGGGIPEIIAIWAIYGISIFFMIFLTKKGLEKDSAKKGLEDLIP